MKNIVISPSRLNVIQACPQKFAYEYIDRIVPLDKSAALEKGSLFHILLEKFYQQKIDEISSGSFTPARIPFICQEAIAAGRIYADGSKLDIKESEAIIQRFREYVVHYKNEKWVPLLVERPFSQVMYQDEDTQVRIILEGKIDLIAKTENDVIIVDHKTGSKASKINPMSNQFLAYAWAFGAKFVVRNFVNVSNNPGTPFSRSSIAYTSAVLEEWLENSIKSVLQMLTWVESGDYLKNYSACYFCPYVPLCSTDKESRDWRKGADFKIVTDHDILKEEVSNEPSSD